MRSLGTSVRIHSLITCAVMLTMIYCRQFKQLGVASFFGYL